jgi:hypothetical protein
MYPILTTVSDIQKVGTTGFTDTQAASDPISLILLFLALTSPRSGGRSVGIVRSRTQATEFDLFWKLG